MKSSRACLPKTNRSALYCFPKKTVSRYAASALAIALILSCAPAKEMTLKEAKQVTVSISGKTFTPPPRNINDILAILEGTSQKEIAELKEAEKIAASNPPPDAGARELDKYFRAKLVALTRLGRFEEAFAEAKEMTKLAEKMNISVPEAYVSIGNCAKMSGDSKQAIEFYERAMPGLPQGWTIPYKHLVETYVAVGNLERAKRWLDEGTRECDSLLRRYPNTPYAPYWNGSLDSMQAAFLEAEGKFVAAERLRRRAIGSWNQYLSYSVANQAVIGIDVSERALLVDNLLEQGRILEAEMEMRAVLKVAIERFGKASSVTGMITSALGNILLRQGKTDEGEELARIGLRNMEDSGIPGDSSFLKAARMYLGNILTGNRKYGEAISEFDKALKEKNISESFISSLNSEAGMQGNPNFILVLIETGRFPEASEQISSAYERESKLFGGNHYRIAELKGLRGVLNYRMKKHGDALADFSNALPVLTDSGRKTESDYLKRQRFIAILEAYLGLLKEIGENQVQVQVKVDPVGESFRIAEILTGKSVSSAMAESSARAAVTDRDLADLIRGEQDASQEMTILQNMLANLAAMPEDEQTRSTVKNMRTRMETLAKARTVLLAEIRGRFPRYTDFINPEPATVDKVQGSLRANEALLVMYPAEKGTYIWSVPQNGNIRFATSKLGRKDLARIVNHLRRSLAPNPMILGDIPEFDLRSAHELYNELLKPVEEGWGQAKDLLIVAPGPLGQIPLSVLPTSPVVLKEGKGALFSSYREVPWLVRKVSITGYPAVSSFLALRSLPEGDPQRKPFVGFGDPVFSKEPTVSSGIPETLLASRGGSRIQVRGIRISETGNLDNKNITSMNLEKLHRLPDTAEEVKEIATALGAKHDVDTFIGERATEKQVKTMDLSDRRVIAFASHALLPWDLDGLDQPAIALSSPTVTGGDEDGLLTMTEIMKLRLNADWVVLSACNTGAASGEGAEAVSGLGRAFFYAGTRAALVTMWPVETTSSRKLVTGIFESQRNDQSLSRARALRKSMVDLIDKGNLIEEPTGNIVASYAHPFFWAPFVMVGDPGKSNY